MTLGTGGDRASETVSFSSVANQEDFRIQRRARNPYSMRVAELRVIQNTDCSIIELIAIFGVIEMIIELAKLTIICRLICFRCRLGFVPDSDFAVRLTFAVMSQKNGATARWGRQPASRAEVRYLVETVQ
jgi:hypothetical protein